MDQITVKYYLPPEKDRALLGNYWWVVRIRPLGGSSKKYEYMVNLRARTNLTLTLTLTLPFPFPSSPSLLPPPLGLGIGLGSGLVDEK